MRRCVKALITATALATLSGTHIACAGDTTDQTAGSQILNGQVTLNTQWSNLNTSVDTVAGDASIQGAAAGNLIDITTMNDTTVKNSQLVGAQAAIGSDINTDVANVWGSVGIGSQALCNGASVSTDPTLTRIDSTQECHAADPSTLINTNVTGIAGDVSVAGSSLGNSFEADSNAPHMPINTSQINSSIGASTVNANVYNVGGTVSLSSSAIGNTSQIIHYSTN